MILENAKKEDMKAIKKLYLSAFPPEERPPFFLIKRGLKKSGVLLLAKENDEFIGFIYLISYLDMVYFFYFAIEEIHRKKGYGSEVLGLIKEKYKGKRIFLAREKLEESASNYSERVKRRDFYMKNGFSDLPINIKEGSVTYDVMGIGGKISPKEYDDLITSWSGKFLQKLVKMELFHI